MSIYNQTTKSTNAYATRIAEQQTEVIAGNYGTTPERPVYGKSPVAAPYFDRELNKPIWWNGANWIDATGSNV